MVAAELSKLADQSEKSIFVLKLKFAQTEAKSSSDIQNLSAAMDKKLSDVDDNVFQKVKTSVSTEIEEFSSPVFAKGENLKTMENLF